MAVFLIVVLHARILSCVLGIFFHIVHGRSADGSSRGDRMTYMFGK